MGSVPNTFVPSRRLSYVPRFAVAAALAIGSLGGCGHTIYAVSASSAESRLTAAKAVGAERYAPYEYWYAHEHLQKAMEEAASADYGDAIFFADVAEEYAEKAIKLSKKAYEGAGR